MTETSPAEFALQVHGLTHRYGDRCAVDGLSLEVKRHEIFALLGPNGSGKTTLFKLASTLASIQAGDILVMGHSVRQQPLEVRKRLGIVFQAPSVDAKLTVRENIVCQAMLYGLVGVRMKQRVDEVIHQLGLDQRAGDLVEKLSGGFKRRVEIAKGMLHHPPLLLMDEPSTGLDPSARLDLWHAIEQLRRGAGVTTLLTTHLLEEAEKADRIAIMHEGRVVALGTPTTLRNELGNQLLSIETDDSAAVLSWLGERGIVVQQIDRQLRVSGATAAQLVAPLAAEFGARIHSLTLGQPSLEDVFVSRTGHKFW